MSRTEGFTLPRIPTSHARATSPTSIQPHFAQKIRRERHGRAMTEPSYTSYLGTPRQDVPHHVYKDIAMYEDVFEKRGSFVKNPTHSIACPLSQEYNSLHDSHCRHLYLNNHKLREHLVNLGLITVDLKIVASTQQQRQKIRAHEMLERRELLLTKMNQKQNQRLSNLEVPLQLPKILSWSISREEERKKRQLEAKEAKRKKLQMAQEKEEQEQNKKKHQKTALLKKLMEQQQIVNAKRQKDDVAKRLIVGNKMQNCGSEMTQWHRDAELIKTRMKNLKKRGTWSKRKKTTISTVTMQSSLDSSSTSITEANKIIMDQLDSSLARVHVGKEESVADQRSKQVSDDQEITEEETAAGSTTLKEIVECKTEDTITSQKEEFADGIAEEHGAPLQTNSITAADGQVIEDMANAANVITTTMDNTAQIMAETVNDGVQEITEQERMMAIEVLDAENSLQLFAALLLEQLSQYDTAGDGYLPAKAFLQVLTSRNLGLRLRDDEMYGIVAQLDPNNSGWVLYGDAIYDLAAMLLQLVVQNTLEIGESQPTELQWSQLSSPGYGYLYLDRTTGQIQRGRPEDYRPFLKDDIFEDSIVDFFETSDINQDGLVDSEEFYQLLVSHDVGGRLFPPQVEQLNESFQQLLTTLPVKQVGLDLQQFATIARMLITFVYQNTFPSAEEWIELDSPKVGRFWLNKVTGETHLPAQHFPPPSDEPIHDQESLLAKSLQTGTLSSALPTITEGPSDEEIDYVPSDQKKDLTVDQGSGFGADKSQDDKKRHKRHKRRAKRKLLEKVTSPPPLRPRSRPASQQSGTKSEQVSSSGDVAEQKERLNATEKLDKILTDSKEDTKDGDPISDSNSQHIILNETEQFTIVEDAPATSDYKVHTPNTGDINSNHDKEAEITAE